MTVEDHPSLAGDARRGGLGYVALGVSAYLVLVIASRQLPGQEYGRFAVLWALAFTLGPGLFVPLEQETSRGVSERRLRGQPSGPLVRRTFALGAWLLLGGVAVVVGAKALGLGLSWPLTTALCAGFCVLLPLHVLRGVAAASGRFTTYSLSVVGEGLARVGALLVAVAAGLTLVPAAWAVTVGPVLALPFLALALRDLHEPGAAAGAPSVGALARALGWLIGSSVLLQLMLNLPTLLHDVLADDSAATGDFLNAAAMSRIPLFVFAGFQAALLPSLVRRLHSSPEGMQQWTRQVLLRALVGTAVVVAGTAALGPLVLRLAFGTRDVGVGALVALAAGTAATMLAMTFVQLLIALGRHALVARVWAAGVVVLVATALVLPGDADTRVSLGVLVGGAAAAAVAVRLAFARTSELAAL